MPPSRSRRPISLSPFFFQRYAMAYHNSGRVSFSVFWVFFDVFVPYWLNFAPRVTRLPISSHGFVPFLWRLNLPLRPTCPFIYDVLPQSPLWASRHLPAVAYSAVTDLPLVDPPLELTTWSYFFTAWLTYGIRTLAVLTIGAAFPLSLPRLSRSSRVLNFISCPFSQILTPSHGPSFLTQFRSESSLL